MRRMLLGITVLLAGLSPGFGAEPYSVVKKVVEGRTTYHLIDAQRKMDFGVVPELGNLAYEYTANGKDVLIPVRSFSDYLQKHWFCCGIPFLAPWADRIDQDYYYFEGKKYLLNNDYGNLLHVPPFNFIIHGLLVFDPRWQVEKTGASGAEGAYITSRLDFFKYPDLLEQFPFAQTYEITYRLKDGKVENTTRVINRSDAEIPVFYGYHPYFRPAGPRQDWQVSINARYHWKVDNHQRLIPTGDVEPSGDYLPHPADFTLGKTFIDDGFSGILRDAGGLGRYVVRGKTETIEVVFDKGYDFGHVYAPVDHPLICIEPATGPTNAFNLNHEGKFPGLIILKPGKSFEAHFWIVPSGY